MMQQAATIALEHTFDSGHRIVGHKGKCARLHGHTYRVLFEIMGEVKEPGFVVDFGDLKDIVVPWDHRLLLWDADDILKDCFSPPVEFQMGVLRVPFNPTAENMAKYLAQETALRFGNIRKCKVTIWETPKSSAFFELVQL